MKRFEVKIPNGYWTPCNIIGEDEHQLVVEFKDLYGRVLVENFDEDEVRAVDVEMTEDLIIDATVKALQHLNDNFIYLDKLDLEILGSKIAAVINEHFEQ